MSEILTLSQSWLKIYQDYAFQDDAESVKSLPLVKKAFQDAQKIIKHYQTQPDALPLAVLVEVEKLIVGIRADTEALKVVPPPDAPPFRT